MLSIINEEISELVADAEESSEPVALANNESLLDDAFSVLLEVIVLDTDALSVLLKVRVAGIDAPSLALLEASSP